MFVPFDVSVILLVFVVSFIGASLQGNIGFGLGPLSVPILAMIDTAYVPGPLLLSALLLNLLIYRRERHAVIKQDLYWAVLGRFLGTMLGAYFLTIFPSAHIKLYLALMVLLAIALSVSGIRITPKAGNLFLAGNLSGFMGTTSSIGGAPMALLYQHNKGPRIRGTLSVVFTFGVIIALISLAVIGKFGLYELKLAATLLPGVYLGYRLSNLTKNILDRGYMRPAVLIASAVFALILSAPYWYPLFG
ncbi:MAG: TSUP family transporter [Caldithrix sp.]|nr:TSUP family transporter [Caldithrix sp.]